MTQDYKSEHWTDETGNPAGGCSTGTGFTVSWQNGPLGRGQERKESNGAFVETLLEVVSDRIEFYQASQFACDENAKAIEHINLALASLRSRTARREASSTEGTHTGN